MSGFTQVLLVVTAFAGFGEYGEKVMALGYRPGDEPIPGFRLTQFMGDGSFGAVWRAEAPGGTEVAIKFIDLRGNYASKELRALQLVKRIRHPNIVPIIGFWLRDEEQNLFDDATTTAAGVNRNATATDTAKNNSAGTETLVVDNDSDAVTSLCRSESIADSRDADAREMVELIVAMGLGDMSLHQRLSQCQEEGHDAIPFGELIKYMEDAARAIDFLNEKRHANGDQLVGIQHCDIKPQNILLVGGAAQLCDLGLARILDDTRQTRMGFSAAYGAPECFTGSSPSAFTDQYSLAISYVELRTGKLPFTDVSSAHKVIQQHLDSQLDLSMLPSNEAEVVRRATSLSPDERFESTREMVEALKAAYRGAPIAVSKPKRSNARSFLAIGAIMTAAIAAAAFLYLRGGSGDWNSLAAKETEVIPVVDVLEAANTTDTDAKDTDTTTYEVGQDISESPSPKSHIEENGSSSHEELQRDVQTAPSIESADASGSSLGLTNHLYALLHQIPSGVHTGTELLDRSMRQIPRFDLMEARRWGGSKKMNIAEAEFRSGNFSSALHQMQLANELDPKSARVRLLHGRLLARDGKFRAAEESYTQAISLDRDLAIAYRLRGIIRSKLEKTEQAKDDLTNALRLDANDYVALRLRALMNLSQGLYDAAATDRKELAAANSRLRVVLPLQVARGATSVEVTDGEPISLQADHPLYLLDTDGPRLKVEFTYDQQRYTGWVHRSTVRSNARF